MCRLPVMTKNDLMDNFDQVVTDGRVTRKLCEGYLEAPSGDYLLDQYRVVASGGSSGRRGVFVYGWDAWAICWASMIRFPLRTGAPTPAWPASLGWRRWWPPRSSATCRPPSARHSPRRARPSMSSRSASRSSRSWSLSTICDQRSSSASAPCWPVWPEKPKPDGYTFRPDGCRLSPDPLRGERRGHGLGWHLPLWVGLPPHRQPPGTPLRQRLPTLS
jgi:hypothetical protein